MLQRIACVVLELLYREVGQPLLAMLTSTLSITRPANANPLSLDKCIDDILNFGSRYINIETAIGRGFGLAAGCQLPKS